MVNIQFKKIYQNETMRKHSTYNIETIHKIIQFDKDFVRVPRWTVWNK